MGRKKQQKRRPARRRPSDRRTEPARSTSGPPWNAILGGIILAGLAGIIVAVWIGQQGSGSSTPTGTPVSLAQRIDGIPCDNNDISYHEHAHLDIFDAGKRVTVPANIGIDDDTCLYWLHTHDNSGEIHLEAPSRWVPTLSEFFDIWRQPLSRSRVARARVVRGQSMRVWVNFRRYYGDPRSIPLMRHTQVTIEIGPPWEKPQPFDFQGD